MSKVARSRQKSNRVGNKGAATLIASSYRSKYETEVASNFTTSGISFDYESYPFKYLDPIVKGICVDCGCKNVAQMRTYTPDFALKNAAGGVVFFVETKGLFTAENRRTLLLMQKQHPLKDIRMLFMRNNKLHKSNPKTYGDWCDSNGIKWAVGKELPTNWKEELDGSS